jgi:protein MpaA
VRGRFTLALAGLIVAGIAASQLWSAPGPQTSPAQGEGDSRVIGQSVQGRAIVAERIGDPAAARVVLVVGVIHGDERGGLKVTAALRRMEEDLSGVQIWIVDALNPDGLAAHARKNSHAVDLNRNFPYRWRGGLPVSNGYYPGPSPASEPETRAAMEFLGEVRPDLSVWYHQPWGAVLACRGRPKVAARYAKLVKMRKSCRGKNLRGTAISWENAELGGTAFVVEFPGGAVSQRTARRHARAVATIAGDD